jgi:type I restriction enzyme M protein
MELTPKGGNRGQFFTPVDVCNLMVEATVDTSAEPSTVCGAFGRRVTISDPAAGSSRNLLAAHAKFVHDKARKPYLIAEDLDLMCCKMSAVNMLMHGCYGEVICHNTLTNPNDAYIGYIINEGMYPLQPGIPTIRIRKDPKWFVSLK